MTCIDDILHRHAAAERLSEAQVLWLMDHGVPHVAIERPDHLARAEVIFDTDGRFVFPDEAREGDRTNAVLMVMYGADGHPEDIAAWSPRTDVLRTWLGRGCWLGDAYGLRLGDHHGLMVFPSVLDWLRVARAGIVVADASLAPFQLLEAGPFIAAGGIPHARTLVQQLATPRPRVLVAEHVTENAA